jgi:hypothetical protein
MMNFLFLGLGVSLAYGLLGLALLWYLGGKSEAQLFFIAYTSSFKTIVALGLSLGTALIVYLCQNVIPETIENAFTEAQLAETDYAYYPEFQTKDAEGGLTIVIQSAAPGNLPAGSYWLQAPTKSGGSSDNSFFLILRVYVPLPEISFTQTWEPPQIVRMDSDA